MSRPSTSPTGPPAREGAGPGPLLAGPGLDGSPDAARGARLRRCLESTLGVPFTEGNAVTPFVNGDRIFPAMLEAIDRARTSIDLLTFIYWKGDIARRFAEALARKAREGVRVRLLLDALGSLPMSDDLERIMREGGVEIRRFRPLPRWQVWKVTHRTHRKVLVVDRRVGFTGGVGIAEEWEGDARDPSEWRETHFRVEGPAVRGLQAAFLDNWLETLDRVDLPTGDDDADLAGNGVCLQVLASKSTLGWNVILTAMRLLMTLAQERLRITTAYFVPDEETVDLLCRRAREGCRVEVLLPGRHTDHRTSQLAGEDVYAPLLEAGVKISMYQRTMLHVKCVTVDGLLAFIGSPNLNQRSMQQDDELALLAVDRGLTAALDEHFDRDLAGSEPIDLARWGRRGPVQRAKEVLVRAIRPQL